MAQNDEGKDDVLEQAAQAGKKVEEIDIPKSPEAEVKTAVSRKLISFATLIEIAKQIQGFEINAIKNPHAKEILKLQAYNLALAALATAEVVPGVEKVNDLTKILAIAQKAAKEGKKIGFFSKLYKDVPPGLMTIIEATDLARAPITPVIPELFQSTINQFKFYKEDFLLGKDLIIDASARFKKIFQPSAEVQAAKLQFAPKMV